MEFSEIGPEEKLSPGEYVFHSPTRSFVLIGKYSPETRTVMAMVNGRLVNEDVANFKKLILTREEHKKWRGKGCSGCKKI
tara:strand:+ start:81 stop:320 length:240 start_codon:yes stop_codon:yes gene_type:complete